MIWPGILLWSLSMLTGPEKFRPGIPGFAEFADEGGGAFSYRVILRCQRPCPGWWPGSALDECRGCGVYSGVYSRVPVLEKASNLVRNSERVATPFFVPRMTGREMYLEAFLWMYRWRVHSVSMWFLAVITVLFLQETVYQYQMNEYVSSGPRRHLGWRIYIIFLFKLLKCIVITRGTIKETFEGFMVIEGQFHWYPH